MQKGKAHWKALNQVAFLHLDINAALGLDFSSLPSHMPTSKGKGGITSSQNVLASLDSMHIFTKRKANRRELGQHETNCITEQRA